MDSNISMEAIAGEGAGVGTIYLGHNRTVILHTPYNHVGYTTLPLNEVHEPTHTLNFFIDRISNANITSQVDRVVIYGKVNWAVHTIGNASTWKNITLNAEVYGGEITAFADMFLFGKVFEAESVVCSDGNPDCYLNLVYETINIGSVCYE